MGDEGRQAAVSAEVAEARSARAGLERVVWVTAPLLLQRSASELAATVVDQATLLLGEGHEAVLCGPGLSASAGLIVLGGAGAQAALVGQTLDALGDHPVAVAVRRALEAEATLFEPDGATLYLTTPANRELVLLVAGAGLDGEAARAVLTSFGFQVAVAFDNAALIERLHNMAYNDHLTRLPNRGRILQMLDELPPERRDQMALALVYIDRFTEVNDALGHSTGDLLLLAVAQRLREAVDSSVVLGRVGAGLYAVLGREDQVDGDRLLAAFEQPFDAGGYMVPVTVHVGVARLRDTAGPGSEAFKGASIAVNSARQDPANPLYFYTRSMEDEGRQKIELLRDLREALDLHQLQVFYQPQVLLDTGRVIGAEALIRWRRPTGEFVSPGRFIPLAEHSGLVIPIGELVLWAACHQVAQWRAEGLHGLRIGVNVSAPQFHKSDFVNTVAQALAETGVAPEAIELEITESAAMKEVEMVIDVMQRLRDLGVTVAIDDFGTGYSSLSYLQRLPADRLKVDQSFIRTMHSHAEGSSIPKMVVDLAHLLGLTAIAEGIEDETQAQLLREMGCEEGQGFWYCRPVEADAFKAWVLAHR